MKIVICDYKEDLERDVEYEKKFLLDKLQDAEIIVYEYNGDKEDLKLLIKDADIIVNTFINFDKELIDSAKKLKCIVLNSVGYNSVDVDYATTKNIAVCPAKEYCTQEVAEHTMSFILALTRGLKFYANDIDNLRIWSYQTMHGMKRLEGQTLGIFGFGKIGQAVAKRTNAFGMKVMAISRHINKDIADKLNVQIADTDYILENADIITNHMSQNSGNTNFFNLEKFKKMKKQPYFINVGRGLSVNEDDLVMALDNNIIKGAGLDVLVEENPNLNLCKLTNRNNVILTPHAAFYSETSEKELQTISCNSVINYLNGEFDKIDNIVNKEKLNL